ncbi:active regulator of SIRT1-like [Harmonia axyridis]|uniref:active regulator of SIRT1-like n=1 Tax=Harmonia axyridis TaxID=115357 RepID=UPI001E277E7F|nr:active regulator of SIRT1-like [Harmonia axyridis]
MSSSIVRKALQIVDDDSSSKYKPNKKMKAKDVLVGGRWKNMQSTKKLTISELRKTMQCKEEIYRKNMEKLELIKKLTNIQLNQDALDIILERGVTGKPISGNPKIRKKKEKTSAFTEEDFKKFEREYTD